MKRAYGNRIRIGLLVCVLVLLFLPQMVWAAPSPPITSVEVSVDIPKIGNEPDCYPHLASGYYTFADCRWFEGSDGSGSTFVGMDSGVFKSGKYYGFQCNLIATGDNTFSESVTATINGVKVDVVRVDSKTILVNRVFGMLWEPLSMLDGANNDIPEGPVGTAIKSYSLRGQTAGGYPPYHYELFRGPSWLKVSSDGTVSGTRPQTAQKATTAVIRVLDDDASSASITIDIGRVTAKPQSTTTDKTKDTTTAGSKNDAEKVTEKNTGQTGEDTKVDPDEDDTDETDQKPAGEKSDAGKSDSDSAGESSLSGSRLGLILGITGIGLGVVLLVLVLLRRKARR